jgi:hypothetical protein
MSDESLRELLDQARKSVEQEIASTSQLKLERAAALDAKFQAFAKSVLPRLEMAKEQWLEEGVLLEFSVHPSPLQLKRNSSISFRVTENQDQPQSIISSSTYFFELEESGHIRIYESSTSKNSLNSAVGFSGADITSKIVDRVLEIAAKDFYRRANKGTK